MKLKLTYQYLKNNAIQSRPFWIFVDPKELPKVKDLARLITNFESPALSKTRDGLIIDGRHFGPEILLSECGIFNGSNIALYFDRHFESQVFEGQAMPQAGTFILAITGGVHSGQYWPLHNKQSKPILVGRSPLAELVIECPGVSPRHLLAKLNHGKPEILDLNSHNGTWSPKEAQDEQLPNSHPIQTNQRFRVGNASLAFLKTPQLDRLKGFGHIPLYRSASHKSGSDIDPRTQASPDASPAIVSLPTKSNNIRHKVSLSWAAIITPVLFGCVMAVIFNPYMALFILMSPLMAISSWLETKFKGRNTRIQLLQKHTSEIADFSKELETLRESEVGQRQKERLSPIDIPQMIFGGSSRLWSRSYHHKDFLKLTMGSWDEDWRPLIQENNSGSEVLTEAKEVLKKLPPLLDVQKDFYLHSQILGIQGPAHIGAALARWLIVQAALLHRPADLNIRLFGLMSKEWEWLSWLPHYEFGEMLNQKAVQMWILDAHTAANIGSHHPLGVMGENACVMVLANSSSQSLNAKLLDECTGIVQVLDTAGSAQLVENIKSPKKKTSYFRVDGISKNLAEKSAQALSRYEDPEAKLHNLPRRALLGEILELSKATPKALLARWETDDQLRIPVGLLSSLDQNTNPYLMLDLLKDGPHGLIAGTTGSGKSELLRTMVAGLSFLASPKQVNFMLIDYKGGSAFDACVGLPHIVGMVTDLTPNMAERSLISLRAELIRREKILKEIGAEDIVAANINAHVKTEHTLARLFILIDEFASMAEELPDFLNSLVEIARRGRSLGVHLILATQRPAGTVSSNIRANANFRIALRVLSEADSVDVLDSKEASLVPRDIPGRACIKLGTNDPEMFQTAQATSSSPEYKGPVAIYNPADLPVGQTTDLEKIIELTQSAYELMGSPELHKPCPEPLPESLDMADLATNKNSDLFNIGLMDLPQKQTQEILSWDPTQGNLGLVGNKSAEWMMSIALSAAASQSPAQRHIYVLDYGGDLAPLAKLPHVGAVCGPKDTELRNQLFTFLTHKLSEGGKLDEGSVPALVLVNNIDSLIGEMESSKNFSRLAELDRLLLEGQAGKIHWILGLKNPINSSRHLLKRVSMRIYSGLKTSTEYLEAGLGSHASLRASGETTQELLGDSGEEVRIMTCGDPAGMVQKIVHKNKNITNKKHAEHSHSAPQIKVLPSLVHRSSLSDSDSDSLSDSGSLTLAFGLLEDHQPASFDMEKSEHLLIAGPYGSGKSTALIAFAEAGQEAGALVTAICSKKSPLYGHEAVEICAESPEALEAATQPVSKPVLVLIDDAHQIEAGAEEILYPLAIDNSGAIDDSGSIHIIAAGRNDLLHRYGQRWLNEVKSCRSGILLRPDPMDGDLLGTRLFLENDYPYPPGRGWMVSPIHGTYLCQTALSPSLSPTNNKPNNKPKI